MMMTKLLAPTLGLVSALATSACFTDSSGDNGATDVSSDETTPPPGTSTATNPCEKIDAAYGGLFSTLGNIGSASFEAYLASAGNEWNVAQMFTPSTTGALSRVRLGLTWSGEGNGAVIVSIIDLGGNPSALTDRAFIAEDHVIATNEISMFHTESWINVQFANQPQVTAGKPYAIEIHVATPAPKGTTAFGQGAVLWDAFAAIPASTIDPYPTGKSFLRNPTTNHLWIASPTAFGVTDQVFETYVIGATCR